MSALAEAYDQLPGVVLGELAGLAAGQAGHRGHRGGGAAAVDEHRVGWTGRLGGYKVTGCFFYWSPQKSLSVEILYENT